MNIFFLFFFFIRYSYVLHMNIWILDIHMFYRVIHWKEFAWALNQRTNIFVKSHDIFRPIRWQIVYLSVSFLQPMSLRVGGLNNYFWHIKTPFYWCHSNRSYCWEKGCASYTIYARFLKIYWHTARLNTFSPQAFRNQCTIEKRYMNKTPEKAISCLLNFPLKWSIKRRVWNTHWYKKVTSTQCTELNLCTGTYFSFWGSYVQFTLQNHETMQLDWRESRRYFFVYYELVHNTKNE
jgi:hypothetical protein